MATKLRIGLVAVVMMLMPGAGHGFGRTEATWVEASPTAVRGEQTPSELVRLLLETPWTDKESPEPGEVEVRAPAPADVVAVVGAVGGVRLRWMEAGWSLTLMVFGSAEEAAVSVDSTFAAVTANGLSTGQTEYDGIEARCIQYSAADTNGEDAYVCLALAESVVVTSIGTPEDAGYVALMAIAGVRHVRNVLSMGSAGATPIAGDAAHGTPVAVDGGFVAATDLVERLLTTASSDEAFASTMVGEPRIIGLPSGSPS